MRTALALIVLSASTVTAQTQLTATRIASGLVRPVGIAHAPGDFSRLFFIEQHGSGGVADRGDVRILSLPAHTVNPAPFLSITGLSNHTLEKGLIGITFHPGYADNGYFFVNYTTASDGRPERTVVERFQVSADPNVADAASGRVVLEIEQPTDIHHGGTVAFGPDGYLYITRGEGGWHNDPNNRAQNRDVLLGKILRIDVNADDFPDDPLRNYAIPPTNPFASGGGAPEIWAYGLRNPWRASFDRQTGDLWFGDVGQNTWEELNFQPASSAGGENYGWRCYEGLVPFNTTGCPEPGQLVFPLHVYQHGGLCSVTAGHVYRGCAVPDLQGAFFFGDWCTGRVWSLRYDGSIVTELTERTAELTPSVGIIRQLTSFGEDAYGEIYIADGNASDGEIYKIVPRTLAGPDCNANGRADACDILDGTSADANGNGVPDSCEEPCPADFDGDGEPTVADFTAFRAAYLAGDPRCDYNDSGSLEVGDFTAFRAAYLAGCP